MDDVLFSKKYVEKSCFLFVESTLKKYPTPAYTSLPCGGR